MRHAKIGVSVALIAILLGASSWTAHAALIVDRGLPDTNLNNAAGADRSNVAWGFAGDFIAGDDFVLPGLAPGQTWRIDKISTWVVDADFLNFSDLFTEISLFLGPDQGVNTQVPRVVTTTVQPNSSIPTNPQVAITPVTYAGGENYQGSSDEFFRIWQIDFLDLGHFAPGDYLFGVEGIYGPNNVYPWFNHASNAALSGTPQDGADDRYRWFAGAVGDASVTFGGLIDSDGYGWDKSSDINIRVYATAVPEPTSLALLGLGLGGLGLAAGRKAKSKVKGER